MKALVTGGGGFLGRYIVEALLSRGDTVRVFSRGAYPELESMGAQCHRGDLRDEEAVDSACHGVDVIFHVAALAGYWGKWQDYYNSNVLGTENILRSCWKHGIGRLVYTSTPSVVIDGSHEEALDESAPYPKKFLCHYAHTKAMAEKKVLSASESGLRTCALRPHLVWGPRDNHLIPRLIARAKAGKLIQVGDGSNLVDHCYVTNAADAHLLAADCLDADCGVEGEAFFITNGKPVKLWDWIADILREQGIDPPRRNISYATARRIGRVMEAVYSIVPFLGEPRMTRFLAMQLATTHYFDISKACERLGYQPKVSLEQGMKNLTKAL